MVPTALTAFLALCGLVLSAVATGLARWSKFARIGASEMRWGLWDFLDQNPLYCEGWVAATAAMIILATVFFFLTLLVALLVLAKKKMAWKTKPLRLVMSLLAFLTFLFTILAVVFWICFNEWPSCWMNYSGATWANVNSTFQYTKYDISWMLACAACGIAMLMTLCACWSVGKTPRAPLPPVMESPVYPEYPMAPAPMYPEYEYAPAYSTAPMYPTAAYPTTIHDAAYMPAYPTTTYAPAGYM